MGKFDIIKLGEAKDGDMLVFRSSTVEEKELCILREQIQAHLGIKIFIAVIGEDDDVVLIGNEKAKNIQESYFTSKYGAQNGAV